MFIHMSTLIDYLERRGWSLYQENEKYIRYQKKIKGFTEDAILPKNPAFSDYNTVMNCAINAIANAEGERAKDIERYAGWMDYADEHVCMLRQLENYTFEALWAKWDSDEDAVLFRHEVIYLEDLKGNIPYWDAILQSFGYKNVHEFAEQEEPSAADYAMYVCESHSTGVYLTEKNAIDLIQRLTAADIKSIPHI